MKKLTRRTVLGAGAAVAAGVAGGWWWRSRLQEYPGSVEHAAHVDPPFVLDPSFPNPLRVPAPSGMHGVMDISDAITLIARPTRHELVPGKPASVLAYESDYHGSIYSNPLIRVRSGAQLRIKLWNALQEPSIIHWHGLKVDSNNDGHPHYAVSGGETYDYTFTVTNRAATYWYHPHPHHLTGRQVYLGLAGLFIVEDDEELALQQALDLHLGGSDIPLVLQDRRFDEAGQLVFAPTAAERLSGHLGSDVLVNLTPRPYFLAATRVYRFRILNGSNARMFRLAFRHGERLLDYRVIGTDGGLLDKPYTVKEAFLAPAERVDVLLDLRRAQPGDALTLASLPFDPMHREAEAHGGHDQHAAHGAAGQMPYAPDGTALDLLRLQVRHRVPYERQVPQALSRIEPAATGSGKPRIITLDQSKGAWRINGLTYDHNATPIVVKRGTTEVWEIRNAARSMPHPMHIHGFQSRVLSREGSPEQQKQLAVTDGGLAATDLGWKDTVLSWPGETVRIVTDFSHPFLGDQVYMVHCHNLEHEDGGMMLNLKVTS
jgi:FtsP/CotA-like multicopper oxidase with cupredoxin domain